MITRKVLIAASYFPPHPGGVEYYSLNIASRLATEHNWQVVVVTTAEGGGAWGAEQYGEIKVYRLPYRWKISNSPLSLRWMSLLRSILKAEQPDIINVHAPVPGLADMVAFVAGSTPIVVSYHSGSMLKGRPVVDLLVWIYEHLVLGVMLRKAKHIICSSDFVRAGIIAPYHAKSETITPAVDVSVFYPPIKRVIAPKLLFVGALNRADSYKGLEVLLHIVAELKKGIPKLELTVVGEGNKSDEYKRVCHRLGIEGCVTFTGRLEGEDLASAYRAASVFVLPSSKDSFPMVIVEAMASGLPVVSTTVGGIPTLIDDSTDGYLVTASDLPALRLAIEGLLGDSTLGDKFGSAGRQKVAQELTWKRQARRTNAVLRRVLG